MAVETIQRPELGEVRVETGTGRVIEFDHQEGKRNVRIEIEATHTQLRYPLKAWADSKVPGLVDNLRHAYDTGMEVAYRIETHRRKDAPQKALADLANSEKVRDLVHIGPPTESHHGDPPGRGDANGTTRVQEHLPPAPGPTHGSEEWSWEPPHQDPPAPEAVVPLSSAEADELEDTGTITRPEAARSVRRGLRVEEAKPWERLNTDGSVNLGSYAFEAAAGMTRLAYQLLIERRREEAAERGGRVEVPTEPTIRALARCFLEASDAVQAAIRADGCADRMDRSHARARGAVRAALDVYPVPWGSDQATRDGWLAAVVEHATTVLRVAITLAEGSS